MGFLFIGNEHTDVRGLHDIVSDRQLTALGFILRYLMISEKERTVDLNSRIDALYDRIAAEGLDTVWSSFFTTCERFLDLPRKAEVRAAICRMRGTKWERK